MEIGNALAQAGHACLQAAWEFPKPSQTPYIYILQVENEEELLEAVERCKSKELPISTFFEPDFPKGYTAAATAPLTKQQRKHFKKYPLFTI